jgi:large conductance mechanosensitive channel
MSFASEFREFIAKGNVMDLAVGVIIGAAFAKIVDSFVGDVVMPVIGAIFGGFDFSNLYIRLGPIPPGIPETYADLKKAGVAMLGYGQFITVALNFVILAFIVFLMVRAVNRIRSRPDPAPAAPKEEVVLLREIRDTLKGRA